MELDNKKTSKVIQSVESTKSWQSVKPLSVNKGNLRSVRLDNASFHAKKSGEEHSNIAIMAAIMAIAPLVMGGASIAAKKNSEAKGQNLAGSCVRPTLPPTFFNKGKWASYDSCIKKNEDEQRAADDRRAALLAAESNKAASSKKVNLMIGIGVLVIGTIITVIVLKKKNSAAPPSPVAPVVTST